MDILDKDRRLDDNCGQLAGVRKLWAARTRIGKEEVSCRKEAEVEGLFGRSDS